MLKVKLLACPLSSVLEATVYLAVCKQPSQDAKQRNAKCTLFTLFEHRPPIFCSFSDQQMGGRRNDILSDEFDYFIQCRRIEKATERSFESGGLSTVFYTIITSVSVFAV